MNKSVLNWRQVVGLEPMSEEEFHASIESGIEEAENGELIPAKRVFAELERRYSRNNAGVYRRAY
ncbi:hypothetical protein IJ103_00870 [Candidatus Saccharibacteria bacterium]|nr:hypothetical protein [Candidatus Saccharibacteria bacterium]MBQ9016784.1 hypothetical protein [Candidatus Saccharibacteria bacterium]